MSKKALDDKKRYFTLEEVQARVSIDPMTLIHMGGHNELPIYVLTAGWPIKAVVRDAEAGHWESASLGNANILHPLLVSPESLLYLEANPSGKDMTLLCDPPDDVEYRPDDDWRYQLTVDDLSDAKRRLVLMASDLALLIGAPPEEILDTKEEYSVSKIIATLCAERGYDLLHPAKAAAALSTATQLYGAYVSPNTVKKYLLMAQQFYKKPKSTDSGN